MCSKTITYRYLACSLAVFFAGLVAHAAPRLIVTLTSTQGGLSAFGGPGGALSEADYARAARAGGFSGNIVVGKDLVSVRLPAK